MLRSIDWFFVGVMAGVLLTGVINILLLKIDQLIKEGEDEENNSF